MCKSSDRSMVIGDVALWEKTGGRSGVYRRDPLEQLGADALSGDFDGSLVTGLGDDLDDDAGTDLLGAGRRRAHRLSRSAHSRRCGVATRALACGDGS